MKTSAFLLALVLATAGSWTLAEPAAAHDRHGRYERADRGDHRSGQRHPHYRHDHRDRHGPGYSNRYSHERKIIVHRPVPMRPPVVREYHHYYHPAAPVYHTPTYYPPRHHRPVYPRDPAIVIGVDIPPLVIPLR